MIEDIKFDIVGAMPSARPDTQISEKTGDPLGSPLPDHYRVQLVLSWRNSNQMLPNASTNSATNPVTRAVEP